MTNNASDTIGNLIARAIHAGVYFPRDPSGTGVQIRVLRSASSEGHRLAAILRERRDEVNAFHAARRPAWPRADDGLPPRLDPDEPDASILFIQLEAVLCEDRIAEFIEQEVAYVEERVAGIVARGVQVRRAIPSTSQRQPPTAKPYEFRGGQVIRR